MVSTILLRTLLFLPLLCDPGHAGHDESIGNADQPCKSWRQSSNSYRAISYSPPDPDQKILREALLDQTPWGSLSTESNSRPPIASCSKTICQEEEVGEEARTPRLEDAYSAKTGRLSNNPDRKRDSRY